MKEYSQPYSMQMQNDISVSMQEVNNQYSFSSALEQLQNFEKFRSFADAVVFFMKKHYSGEIPSTREFSLFERTREEASVPVICTDRTWRNWKKDTWPTDRETAFMICFALSLSAEETIEFFEKAFFDRPFDSKSALDVVCYYCLEKRLKWEKVNSLIETISNTDVKNTELQFVFSTPESAELETYTKDKLFKDATEEVLIAYCVMLNEIQAEQHNQRLKCCAKKWLTEAQSKCEGYLNNNNLASIMKSVPLFSESDIEQSAIGCSSFSSLLNTVLGIKLYNYQNDSKTTKSALKFMKKMVVNQLPSPDVLNQIYLEECSNTIFLRNTIILMSFFCLCLDKQSEIAKRINQELILSGTCQLYCGSPFDWLFVFSLQSDCLSPLECFQALFDSALEVKRIIRQKEKNIKKVDINNSVYNDLTDNQKELLVLARSGIREKKEELANSFLLPNEKQQLSLFEKTFEQFKKRNRKVYQGFVGTVDYDDNRLISGRNSTGHSFHYDDEFFKKVFLLVTIKAIDSYDENLSEKSPEKSPEKSSLPFTSWITLKCNFAFRRPADYEKYIPQASLGEEDYRLAECLKKYVKMLDDNRRWIMEYRLGLNGPICNSLVDLQEKMMETHSIEIDREDILSAERKFIRLIKLSNAKRRIIKNE